MAGPNLSRLVGLDSDADDVDHDPVVDDGFLRSMNRGTDLRVEPTEAEDNELDEFCVDSMSSLNDRGGDSIDGTMGQFFDVDEDEEVTVELDNSEQPIDFEEEKDGIEIDMEGGMDLTGVV